MSVSLARVYEGWDGFNTSLIRAIEPRKQEELAYRVRQEARSLGEVAAHIAFGRIDWFRRMDAPLSRELEQRAAGIGARGGDPASVPRIAGSAEAILHWLDATWEMVDATLNAWTVDDLFQTYRHAYHGKVYAISRQWTIWRMLTHDVYHGGQIAEMLQAQGIHAFELVALGGHLTEPPVVG